MWSFNFWPFNYFRKRRERRAQQRADRLAYERQLAFERRVREARDARMAVAPLDGRPSGCKSSYCEPPWCKNCGDSTVFETSAGLAPNNTVFELRRTEVNLLTDPPIRVENQRKAERRRKASDDSFRQLIDNDIARFDGSPELTQRVSVDDSLSNHYSGGGGGFAGGGASESWASNESSCDSGGSSSYDSSSSSDSCGGSSD